MPLISEAYREENRKLHETAPHYGIGGGMFKQPVAMTVEKEGHRSVLDYGCGKGTLKMCLPNLDIREYDPAIPGKEADPEPADLVLCTDVLEHIEPQHLNAVLRHMASKTLRKIMLNIATREADKDLEDGRNAHLIVKDEKWWREKILQHFQITEWTPMKGKAVYCEAFPIKGSVLTAADLAVRKPRPITPDLKALQDYILATSAKYADKFTRLETIEMWEGKPTQRADVIFALLILNQVNDIDAALQQMMKLTRKLVMVDVEITDDRNAAMWRRVFERKFRIADWHTDGGRLLFSGAPMVGVEGITAIGAVEDDTRWDNVVKSMARVSKRIELAETNPERIALVCYGPSLADDQTMEHLRKSIAGGAKVVSVSGAHDFLLSQGIVPDFHVECDPRPHKALNIVAAHPTVKYLIASVCHQDVFDRLDGADVSLWHVATAEHQRRLVDECGEKGGTIISGGGSVGLRAVTLLYAMGYRNYAIYGMDSSFRFPDEIYEKAVELAIAEKHDELQAIVSNCQQWAGRHFGKVQDVVGVDCGGRILFSSPQLLTYATYFFEMAQQLQNCQFELIGNGLLQSMGVLYNGLEQTANIERAA